jgi:DNA repair protein RadA/Sms
MTRTRVRYHCIACGYESPKWMGRCGDCGEWGTFGEVPAETSAAGLSPAPTSVPQPLSAVSTDGVPRRSTELTELDRVLGGGLVAGSVTLLGGEPGIGKSTILLQALAAMSGAGAKGLLVCAEESSTQVKLRADRLGEPTDDLLVVTETSVPAICAHAETIQPDVLVVDSIQSVHDPDGPGAAGSVTQVRDCAQRLVRLAKERNIATVLVGHVTKDGALAGPRVLEHVVDTVLSFEGDRHHALRLLRALKHRFGSTDELGLMEMRGDGLHPVADPSALFLADRRPAAPGSVVAPVLEGVRPLCVEIQALVDPTEAPIPRRVAQALDSNRLAMLLGILQRRARVPISRADVYVSVAGGIRVTEPAADLAVACAIASARRDRAIEWDAVVLGEIGLGGEIRQVPHAPRRLAEARRLGFDRAIVPNSTPDVPGMTLVRVGQLREALLAAGA